MVDRCWTTGIQVEAVDADQARPRRRIATTTASAYPANLGDTYSYMARSHRGAAAVSWR